MKLLHVKSKIGLTAAYAAVVLVWWALDLPCLFLWALHIPCPGCGMVRAVLSALHFDFLSAFRYHAMFWAMPILYAYFWLDHGIFKNKRADGAVLIGIGAGFVINWVLHL